MGNVGCTVFGDWPIQGTKINAVSLNSDHAFLCLENESMHLSWMA